MQKKRWSSLAVLAALWMLATGPIASAVVWNGAGTNNLASNPTNWVGGDAPIAGDTIMLDAGTNKNMTWDLNLPVGSWLQDGYLGTVTVATVYGTAGFTNFVILGDCVISNGVWTQTANPNSASEVRRLRASIGGNLTIGPDAVINVTAKGYAAGKGPGAGASGSYGGRGATTSGSCYGSITAPVNLGSGGGNTSGGGAILLSVAGTIYNHGLLCADGGPSVWWTGSGGSIYLISGALTGGGTIRAKGGTATTSNPAGGGRVALVVTNEGAGFSGYTGAVQAFASGASACAGTIYLEKQDDVPGKGELIVNNLNGVNGNAAYSTDLGGIEAATCEFSHITLTNGANLNIGADDTLIATNTVLAGAGGLNNGIWISGGTLRASPVFVYSNLFIAIRATDSAFNPATSLTIAKNAIFCADVPYVLTGDVIVEAGGNLTHTANGASETYKMNLTVNGSLNVRPGGRVDVTDKGFASGRGPGAGTKGGSYGGRGGGSGVPGASPVDPTGTHPYGSIVAPTSLGSGGGYGAGGGAIRMTVSGEVNNEGLICANGSDSTYYRGSGGSIYLTAGILIGTGPIQANGGRATSSEGLGGGGRIALVVTNAGADFSGYAGPITAYRGTNATGWGGAGTVYLRTEAQGRNEGTLIIDNNMQIGFSTEINSTVTDTVVGDVLIRNGAYLLLCTNQTLTVSGVWSNGASFESQWGSQVIFTGAASSTSSVYGASTFMGFICTNGTEKTILFQSGKTNAVAAQGRLMLKGAAEGANLLLRPTVDNSAWNLKVDSLAEQVIWNVDVKDSDALSGVEVTAINSRDGTGNQHWRFIDIGGGDTNEWTGASNTTWSVRQNWSQSRPPVENDFILIPGGLTRYPMLDAARTVNGIEIRQGASLLLNSYNLTVRQAATVAGAITASGTENITFQANVDFTGGAFTAARSTILLAGSGVQTVNLGNLACYKVSVANANTVAFDNGFSATELRCEAADGTRNMTFRQGTTVSLRDFVMLGSTASINIFLRSSAPGQKWSLTVSGYHSVRGVDVQDSDASSGLPIPALSSKDSTGNLNWVFTPGRSVWLGASADFHNAANWSPFGVPGATTRVLVDAAKPMTITGTVTVLDLTVGGGTGAVTGTVNAALTVIENIAVLTNGTLILNRPCVVSNGLYVLAGGLLTHSANGSTEVSKLDVTVAGNVGVDMNGTIDVSTKGYATGKGPGGGNAGSYGGRGDPAQGSGPCYGSIVAPTNLGSGGLSTVGGGAILLKVAGAIRNEGLLAADGAAATYYTGSGGSVYLFAGALTGVGTIRANGGTASGGYVAGGGGRIALVVTNVGADFSGYAGLVQVRGSKYGSSGCKAGAGTIYRQCAEDRPGRGMVLVDNNGLTSSGTTDVPAFSNGVAGEADRAVFHVANAATLRLTNDFTVGDIWLDTANAWLDLGSNTLTVNARQHPLGLVENVRNPGTIIWTGLPPGVLIIVK